MNLQSGASFDDVCSDCFGGKAAQVLHLCSCECATSDACSILVPVILIAVDCFVSDTVSVAIALRLFVLEVVSFPAGLEEQAFGSFGPLSRIASTLSLGLLAAKWILAGEQAGYPLVACFCMVSANTELLATAGLVAHLRSLLVKVAIQRQAAVGQTAGCGWNPTSVSVSRTNPAASGNTVATKGFIFFLAR